MNYQMKKLIEIVMLFACTFISIGKHSWVLVSMGYCQSHYFVLIEIQYDLLFRNFDNKEDPIESDALCVVTAVFPSPLCMYLCVASG